MRLNIPDCILQINKSNNYIKKLVFEKRTVECQPQKVDCGYVIDLGLDEKVKTPNVGILNNLENIDEIKEIIEKSNVVVTTMQLCSKLPINIVNTYFSHLFVDEAHHMSAQVWGNIVDKFNNKIVQFTATPFRNDGKIIKGKVIYNFPLAQAQKKGYFKHINFEPLLIFNEKDKDKAIAQKAIEKLDEDIKKGYDHVIMARVENTERAREVFEIYNKLGKKYNPRYIYSTMNKSEKTEVMEQLKNKKCRIIICVKMLGEGFDFPKLKIAAIHDQHKTLGITLQFIGRFTRTSNNKIGDATAIANIIDEHADQYLNMLYKENADWDKIINIASNEKIDKHIKITDYLTKEKIKEERYDIIFDDDGKGEIADIIAIKSNEAKVVINFYHCKFSKGEKPGKRLDDLYQVCGQAQRSVYWKTKLEKMFRRMIERDRAYINRYGVSRFIIGNEELLNVYKNKLKVYDIQLEIYIVQPGVTKQNISNEMLKLLGVTQNWCQETYMIPFKVITSK